MPCSRNARNARNARNLHRGLTCLLRMKPGRPSLPLSEKALPFSIRLKPSRLSRLNSHAKSTGKTAGKIVSELIDTLPLQK